MDNELLKALGTLLDEKLEPVKNELKALKDDVKILKNDVTTLKDDVISLKDDVISLKGDVNTLKTQQEESYQILKSLEHNSEVNKAEHDKFSNEIAQLTGEIQSMRKDLSTVEIVTARNMESIAQLKIIK